MNAMEEQMPIRREERAAPRSISLERYAPLIVWIIAALTLMFISFRIIGSGYLPAGDARRHVAKAFTDKSYSQIVVMRPEYKMDHSPGWEWLLRILHRFAGMDRDALMSFSIVATLLCVLLAPLPWLKRPEAWLAALLAQMVAIPELMTRLTQARPYLLTEGILIALLFAWSAKQEAQPSRRKLALTCVGIALSTWVHGAWYLWALPVAGFLLAGWWRTGIAFSACCAVGTFGGALLTGRPVEFLTQAVWIAATVAREHIPQWVLVGEFRPSYGEFSTLVLVTLVVLWRRQQEKHRLNFLSSPVFCLVIICWVLGFKADRFWADWGVPAVLVWLTLEFQKGLSEIWQPTSWKRGLATALLAVPLFLHSTNDLDRRYSRTLDETSLDASQPGLKDWVPESRGVFYTADLGFFYNTFYQNPEADWRYILGMEPALMPEADLRIFRRIQMSHYAFKAYEPWVEKMRPGDRLEITCASKPGLPQLEWTNAVAQVWIGRLPASNRRPGEDHPGQRVR